MKKHIVSSILYTVITALVLGLGYPLALTALAHVAFPTKADGQLIRNAQGEVVGSALIGQAFTGDRYFNSRPSAAGAGYDAASSGGSNLGPSSKALRDRVQASVAAEGAGPVPVDLVTASGSGLDPDITPAAALYQVPRVAKARGVSEDRLRALVAAQTTPRQFGFLGEPRVNVLLLNMQLETLAR